MLGLLNTARGSTSARQKASQSPKPPLPSKPPPPPQQQKQQGKTSFFSIKFKNPFKSKPTKSSKKQTGSLRYPKMGDAVSAVLNGEAMGHEPASEAPVKQVKRNSGPKCVECEEEFAAVHCVECDDAYCGVCFKGQHRKGSRAKHITRDVGTAGEAASADGAVVHDGPSPTAAPLKELAAEDLPQQLTRHSPAWYNERAKFIPVRLSMKERKMLRLLSATLSVCDYTGKIDVGTFKNAVKRTHAQMQNFSAILTGLVIAKDYQVGQELVESKDFAKFQHYFRTAFEVARRHKIMNPEKMRTNYGKMVYMLQDAVTEEVKELLGGFDCVQHIESVRERLEKHGVSIPFRCHLSERGGTTHCRPGVRENGHSVCVNAPAVAFQWGN